jgi:predicted nucleotidyltransferase
VQMNSLASDIEDRIHEFLKDAKHVLADNLVSAVLFGSATEGNLSVSSDINLLLILKTFRQSEVDLIRDSFRSSHALIHLEVMFLLESEKEHAMNAFSVKFSDILFRRKVLLGPDPFENHKIPTFYLLHRTQQILLNLKLRLRERYVLVSQNEEQLVFIIADVIGPLRACASAILKLENGVVTSPINAFATLVSDCDKTNENLLFGQIDQLRQHGSLPPGTTKNLLFNLLDIAQYLYERAALVTKHMEGEACDESI